MLNCWILTLSLFCPSGQRCSRPPVDHIIDPSPPSSVFLAKITRSIYRVCTSICVRVFSTQTIRQSVRQRSQYSGVGEGRGVFLCKVRPQTHLTQKNKHTGGFNRKLDIDIGELSVRPYRLFTGM